MTRSEPTVVVRATAPAKLNLGLAIVGRRHDGFHELRTIMQTITLCDRLTLTAMPGGRRGTAVTLTAVSASDAGIAIDDPGLEAADNLAVKAVAAVLGEVGYQSHFGVGLEKGIPAASGMGGASADAAAAILMSEQALGYSLENEVRDRLAADLGSDVPFFLSGGTALVGGRGERIDPLPPVQPASFVVVFPRLKMPIPRKTARLFGALVPDDFSNGDAVSRQAARIASGQPLDPALLENGFGRALIGLIPELAALGATIATITGQTVALTGAGPTHYVVEPDRERADRAVEELRSELGTAAVVVRCDPWDGPPALQVVRSATI